MTADECPGIDVQGDVAELVAKYRAKSAEFLEDWQDWDSHDGHERYGQGIAYSDVADELEKVAAAPEGVDAAEFPYVTDSPDEPIDSWGPTWPAREIPADELAEAERCTTCHGRAVVYEPGHYVPGEQFVEPPSEDLCPDCLATGFRVVQELGRERDAAQAANQRVRDVCAKAKPGRPTLAPSVFVADVLRALDDDTTEES